MAKLGSDPYAVEPNDDEMDKVTLGEQGMLPHTGDIFDPHGASVPLLSRLGFLCSCVH